MADAKAKEAEALRRQDPTAALDKRRAEVKAKYAAIRALKEERNRLEDGLLGRRQATEQAALRQKQLDRESKAKEAEGLKLEKKLFALNADLQELHAELSKEADELRKGSSRLGTLERTFDELVQELKTLEEDGLRKQQELQQARLEHQSESQASRELGLKLGRLESEVRHRERELDDLTKKRNAELAIHDRQETLNQSLNDRLDRSVEAIQECREINQEVAPILLQLAAEIRAYCQTDEKAREILNRAGRMQEVLAKVERKLRGSGAPI